MGRATNGKRMKGREGKREGREWNSFGG